MAFERMAWADLLANPPTETEDFGWWLSGHTEGTPTNLNELDPATHPGYTRIGNVGSGTATAYSSMFSARSGASLSAQEWKLQTGGSGGGGNTTFWPTSWSNKGGEAWPPILSVGLNYGPDAKIPRSTVSSRVASLTLAAGWTLGAGRSGLPPDSLYEYGIAKPATFATGGLYGPGNVGSNVPNIAQPSGGLLQQLSGNTPRILPGVTPAGRAALGRGLPQVPFMLAFANESHFPLTAGVPTSPYLKSGQRVAGFWSSPYSTSFLAFVTFGLSDDRTKIENKNDVLLNVTAPVTTAPDYWFVECPRYTPPNAYTRFSSRGGRLYPDVRSLYSSSDHLGLNSRGFPVLYGPVDSSVPALAQGEGVIEAGALSITL